MLSLQQINAAGAAEFVALLDGTYEHSPWVAELAVAQRPASGFASLAALKLALAVAVRGAGRERQLTLIRAHPELAGKAMVSKSLTAESTNATSAWSSSWAGSRLILRPTPQTR